MSMLRVQPRSVLRFALLSLCVGIFVNQLLVSVESLMGEEVITLQSTEAEDKVTLPSVSICK